MRCLACDFLLTDAESVKKSPTSGEFLDLCGRCIATIPELDSKVGECCPVEDNEIADLIVSVDDPMSRVPDIE